MKFILWGYPLHSDTYSYVHEGLKRGLEYMGHQVFWFHDGYFPKDFDYDECIFITEGFADKNIPLRKSSIYFVHVCVNPLKYLGNVKLLIDLRYHQDKMDNDNYEFDHSISSFDRLSTGFCVDRNESATKGYFVSYIAWATDLLPHEIDLDWVNIKRDDIYYFVGTMSDSGRFANKHLVLRFAQLCKAKGVKTVWSNPWNNPLEGDVMRNLMQRSYLSPDLRNKTHVEWGTKTCRIFKSISYGQLGLTNSPKLAEFAGPLVICRENIDELFEEGLRYRADKKRIEEQMKFVRDNHTYINRISGMLRLI